MVTIEISIKIKFAFGGLQNIKSVGEMAVLNAEEDARQPYWLGMWKKPTGDFRKAF